MPAVQPAGNAERHLRVAFIWNGTLQAEETLEQRFPVIVGSGPDALFPLPEGAAETESITLLEPAATGYALRLTPSMGGDLFTDGQRRSVRELIGQAASVPVGPDDYGVVTLGTVAFFFQHVRAARKLPRKFFPLDGPLVAAMALSAFLVTCFMVLLIVAADQFDRLGALELPGPLVRRFMVTPPPEDILQDEQESGTETPDPGLRSRDEAGGRRFRDEEGRVGNRDATQENTEIEGPHTGPVATKVRHMGLLGVLSGGSEGNAIAAALDAPHVSDLLSGLGSLRTRAGQGSGGAGLVGEGPGGGGDGPGGGLFGAGRVGTGVGTGRGSGLGRGRGGIGAKGRPRERTISVQRGTPRVSGYLSAEQINRVVRANAAAIRYCYETQVQRQPNLRGRVAIQWRINLRGSVTTARVASSTLGNASVEGCMVRQIRRWRFPEPDGGEVVVTYPFIFGVRGG